jgi:YD repeat-containing protein
VSDLAKWKVHGPVATLRTERAEWDLAREEWQPARGLVSTSFRRDGAVSATDFYNPDGSIVYSRSFYDDAGRLTETTSQFNDGPIDRTVYSYDPAGRHLRTLQMSHDGTTTNLETCNYDAAGKRTKVRFLASGGASAAYGTEGSERAYPAPGATTMTTTYDERTFPSNVVFQDVNGNAVTQLIFMRDSAGRLLSEEMHSGGESLLQGLVEKVPLEDRDKMAALFKAVFDRSFSRTTCAYDAQGRLVEREDRMGSLSDDHTTYRYADRNDPIEEVSEHRSREAGLDESGAVRYAPDRVSVQQNRFEYVYDPHGNWTERIMSYRVEPNLTFQRSNIERRVITYHAE